MFAAESTAGVVAPLNEHQVLILLAQLVLLVGAARLMGAGMKQLGQPPVIGELLAGVVLGPSILGRAAPRVFEEIFVAEPVVNSVVFGIAWLGVIMLLVAIGFETDLGIIVRLRRAAVSVAAGSLLAPLAVGFVLGMLVPASFVGEGASRALFGSFFGLALAVSALPVVAKILQDLGYLRRNFGQIMLASGMTMDAVGWLLLAALAGMAQEGLDVPRLLASLGGLVVFLAVFATVGRAVIDRLFRRALARGSNVTAALSIALLAALSGAAITQWLRLEAILGAFIVGILLSVTRHQLPEVREQIETFTGSFFAPVFFAFTGLRVNLTTLESGSAIAWAIAVVILAMLAKVGGTYLGARRGGVSHREGIVLGAGLSALGAMGIVVAIIGFNLGVVSETGYTVLVLAAIVTSVAAPPALRLSVRNWEVSAEERRRLERESLVASSVILGSRRILLPTRGGDNSRYAARLIAAVFDDAEVTVLGVEVPAPGWWMRVLRRPGGASADPVAVAGALGRLDHRTITHVARDPAAAISQESRLGYDLVVMGASEENTQGTDLFPTVMDRTLARLQIPTLVVRLAAGVPEKVPRRVLVPVTASAATRAAEEFAYSLVKRTRGSVLALHVVNRPESEGLLMETARIEEATRVGGEMLAGAVALGSRLGVTVDPLVRVAPDAEREIVELANGGEFDLLVLGTSSRPLTSRPFFGHGVTFMIENAAIPVVIIGLPGGIGQQRS